MLFPGLGLHLYTITCDFSVVAGDLNSGPQAYVAGGLVTEPSPLVITFKTLVEQWGGTGVLFIDIIYLSTYLPTFLPTYLLLEMLQNTAPVWKPKSGSRSQVG